MHRWLGFDDDGKITATYSRKPRADENGAVVDSRKRSREGENTITPQVRKQKEIMVEDLSPASNRLMEIRSNLTETIEFRKEEKDLRKRFNM